MKDIMRIKTIYGIEDFHGVRRVKKTMWFTIITTSSYITTTLDHKLHTYRGMMHASDIGIGDYIIGGGEVKKKLINTGEKYFYDILSTDSGTFIANDMSVSNCKWLSSKATLVDSRVIEAIVTKEPIREDKGLKIFVDSFIGRTISISIDPSEGVGGDNHCIQIFDTETLEQLAVYTNNTDNQHMLTKKIIDIITLLFNNGAVEVYYGVENNGVGNGVLRLLESANNHYLDRATMISSTDKDGIIRKSGISMTASSKRIGCAQLKQMIENLQLIINDPATKVELQFFIKSGNSFKAERGAKDDRVMSLVVTMLMFLELTVYEDTIDDAVNDIGDEDDEHWGFSF